MGKTLRELQSEISHQLRSAADDTLAMRSVIDELATPGRIRNLLQLLLPDTAALESIARHSFAHHNGFDKITLLSSEQPEYKLRLHIWWPEQATAGQEHIHNHSWNFSSALITGAFRFQLFQVAEKGTSLYQYLCGFPDAGMGYKMVPQGQACLQCAFDCLMPAGSAYSLFYDSLHQISNISQQLTSSIMLHGPFIRQTSWLFSREPITGQATQVQAIPFKPDELSRKLSRYLSLIP